MAGYRAVITSPKGSIRPIDFVAPSIEVALQIGNAVAIQFLKDSLSEALQQQQWVVLVLDEEGQLAARAPLPDLRLFG